jgi:histone acetyltransferase 1
MSRETRQSNVAKRTRSHQSTLAPEAQLANPQQQQKKAKLISNKVPSPPAPSSPNKSSINLINKSNYRLVSSGIHDELYECVQCNHLFYDLTKFSNHLAKKPTGCVGTLVSTRGSKDSSDNKDDYRVHANSILSFKMIHDLSDLKNDYNSFPAVFTHQLFSDEEIYGYRRLSIDFFFTAGSLFTYYNYEFEEKLPDADNVEQLINSKLLAPFTNDLEEFKRHIGEKFIPPGDKLYHYTIPTVETISGTTRDLIEYEIYAANFTNSAMKNYHKRIQFFLLFFIDRSSYINDNDHVWEVLLLIEKRSNKLNPSHIVYNFVGYTTLYRFLHFPSEWRLRLSQILIIPPYQRSGHGQQLLQFVYQLAEQRDATEINIEDPSPVFQLLRDLLDVQLAKKHAYYSNKANITDVENMNHPLHAFRPEYSSEMRRKLRITAQQARRIYEILKLNCIEMKNCKQYTAYRLEVKRRLAVENEELLSVYSHSDAERKEKLAEIYKDLETHYLTVIKKGRLGSMHVHNRKEIRL